MNKPKDPSPEPKSKNRKATISETRPPRSGVSVNPTQPTFDISGRKFANPSDYRHPYPSMAQFAELLALRYDANRTRHAYYRGIRLLQEHYKCDPSSVTEKQLRDYLLFVKLKKMWKPKTLRQTLASAKLFFVGQLGHKDWQVFSQVRAKDHHTLPPVLTRQQVVALLAHIRLRRYRTPIKLIYCCGLRLGECLAITIHDILGKENKLWVRNAKGHRDRMVPLPTAMYQELRKYWAFHQHPLMLLIRMEGLVKGLPK